MQMQVNNYHTYTQDLSVSDGIRAGLPPRIVCIRVNLLFERTTGNGRRILLVFRPDQNDCHRTTRTRPRGPLDPKLFCDILRTHAGTHGLLLPFVAFSPCGRLQPPERSTQLLC